MGDQEKRRNSDNIPLYELQIIIEKSDTALPGRIKMSAMFQELIMRHHFPKQHNVDFIIITYKTIVIFLQMGGNNLYVDN